MKFGYACLWASMCVGAIAACGGGSTTENVGGKSGSASGGKGGSASGGKGGSASGGKGGNASGGSGSGGSVTPGSGGAMGGSGGAVMPMGGQAGAAVVDLTAGLIGYWSFDDATGTAIKDLSGKGNAGVVVEGLTDASPVHPGPMWVDGKKGKAMAFDGLNDWVKVSRSDSIDSTGTSGSVSISAWLKLNQFGQAAANSSYNMILNRHEVGTGYEHFGLGIVSGKPVANVHFFFAQAAEVVKVNGWTHLTMTYDGITESIYVDGVLGASGDIGWPIAADTTNVTIGGAQNTDVIKEFVDGTIDEVHLFNRALSASEVVSLMNK